MLADWAAIAIAQRAPVPRGARAARRARAHDARPGDDDRDQPRARRRDRPRPRARAVVKRSRALIDARAAEIALLDGDEFVVAAVAGEGVEGLEGLRVPIEDSLAAEALRTRPSQRFDRMPARLLRGARARRAHGDRHADDRSATAPSASCSCSTGSTATGRSTTRTSGCCRRSRPARRPRWRPRRTPSEEALRRSIEASEAERTRWARELHDETLQQLAGLRVLLSGARRSGDADRMRGALDDALEQITDRDRRPALADHRAAPGGARRARRQAGAGGARRRAFARQTDLEIELEVDLALRDGDARSGTPEIESTIYRLVQEALTNVAKHAARHARRGRASATATATSRVHRTRRRRRLRPAACSSSGFGLIGMRERLALVNGRPTSSPRRGTAPPSVRRSRRAGAGPARWRRSA